RRALPFGRGRSPAPAARTFSDPLPPLGLNIAPQCEASVSASAAVSAHGEHDLPADPKYADVAVKAHSLTPSVCNQFNYVDVKGQTRKAIAINLEKDVELDFALLLKASGSVTAMKVGADVTTQAQIVAHIVEHLIATGSITIDKKGIPGVTAPAGACPQTGPQLSPRHHHPKHAQAH
ncbi:hypothetical protein V8E36_005891, partial [Tilletia maclaganii]